MQSYPNPEPNVDRGLKRIYVSCKCGAVALPQSIDLHLSKSCNLSCDWCIGKNNCSSIKPPRAIVDKGNVVPLLTKMLPADLANYWPSIFNFAGGFTEPLSDPESIHIFKTAADYLLLNNRVLRLVTNGLNLNEDGVIPLGAAEK